MQAPLMLPASCPVNAHRGGLQTTRGAPASALQLVGSQWLLQKRRVRARARRRERKKWLDLVLRQQQQGLGALHPSQAPLQHPELEQVLACASHHLDLHPACYQRQCRDRQEWEGQVQDLVWRAQALPTPREGTTRQGLGQHRSLVSLRPLASPCSLSPRTGQRLQRLQLRNHGRRQQQLLLLLARRQEVCEGRQGGQKVGG